MHKSAMQTGQWFFEQYVPFFSGINRPVIVEVGSMNVNGSLREVAPVGFAYIGVDFAPGPGVDVVLSDPYKLPFDDNSVDMVVSSSCFEHSELFWVSFLEIMRILKPRGLFYLNAPSNGPYHRYPVDCWRFYPDSGGALVTWAKRNGYRPALLESFVGEQAVDPWNDFVAVFLKDEGLVAYVPPGILERTSAYRNGVHITLDAILNKSARTEDQSIIYELKERLEACQRNGLWHIIHQKIKYRIIKAFS